MQAERLTGRQIYRNKNRDYRQAGVGLGPQAQKNKQADEQKGRQNDELERTTDIHIYESTHMVKKRERG